jgi:phosphate:Na+ symporter
MLTGVVAFLSLPLFLRAVLAASAYLDGEPGATSLALFHTAFNLLGVLLFLPFLQRFSGLVMRLVPEGGPALTRHLDRTVANVPEVAVEAARRTGLDIAMKGVEAAQALLSAEARREEVLAQLEAAEGALGETRRFLASVGTAEESAEAHRRHVALLHACDHLGRFISVCREVSSARTAVEAEAIASVTARLRELLAEALRCLGREGSAAAVEHLGTLASDVEELRRQKRSQLLARTAEGSLQPGEVDRFLEALRWEERLALHTWRAVFHLQARPEPAAPTAEPERRAG